MRYRIIISILWGLAPFCIFAQNNVWNYNLPMASLGNSGKLKVQPNGSNYLLAVANAFTEFDHQGKIISSVAHPVNALIGDYVQRKTNTQTGRDYFLLAYRSLASRNVVFEEFHPGIGFINKSEWADNISLSSTSPVVLDVNDSVVMVFGNKYLRQMTHRPGKGMILNWEKPAYQGDIIAASKTTNGGYVIATRTGFLKGLNATGDSLWIAQTNNFDMRYLAVQADGFLVCGSEGGNAVLNKYMADGAPLWQKKYNSDKTYRNIAILPNGDILLIGQSIGNEAIIQKTDASGNTIWHQVHQAGLALGALPTPDGGFIVAGNTTAPNRYFLFKTDVEGKSIKPEKQLELGSSNLENELMRVPAFPRANLFFDYKNSLTSFQVPKDKNLGLFFSAGVWIGGLDPSGTLRLCATVYDNDDRTDFETGMMNAKARDFNRVWKVTRRQIEALRQDWADNGVLDQPVPHDILSWPARQNPDFKQNLDFSVVSTDPNLLPAPFVDANGDGRYQVRDGDYPKIKGDQMAWWVLNDDTLHRRSNGQPLRVDMMVSAYLFDCASTSQAGSLFIDYEVISRGQEPLTEMYMGLWNDFDLGCAYDDYLGCLPQNNSFYVYNQDAVDGNNGASCDGILTTYGDSIPIGSITLLNRKMNKFIYYLNGSPPPPTQADPTQASEYYNYLKGLWRDGTMPTYNGQPVSYLYDGNPATPGSFSMCGDNLPLADQRGIGSHGPFTLMPNDTFTFNLAFTYHPLTPHPCPNIFGDVKSDIETLQKQSQNGILTTEPKLRPLLFLAAGSTLNLDASTPNGKAYQWSNSSTNSSISTSQPGVYTVTITRISGCTQVEIVKVKASTSTQASDEVFQLASIFPNPNAGQFTLDLQGTPQHRIECQLINAVGQSVHQEMLDFRSGHLNKTFEMPHLPPGVYMLRLQAGAAATWRKVVRH